MVARIVGARPRVSGTPVKRDVLIVSNHLSWIDILVLAEASGARLRGEGRSGTSAADRLALHPHRTIFIARSDRAGVEGQIATIRDGIAAGQPVTVFPKAPPATA